ncbi:putative tetratricopeptide-like helical domain-containing protein [Lupinus albus]|uniref:Putative tetratricopeptide-like helical domain-containing protein n=1 Tax=Lupinus albus TaxID=3870 RepID=A0A6A4PJT0_LUPAL|nr:putative tetratricopeptide-like helical domain-containing protein [Lupinus albus]
MGKKKKQVGETSEDSGNQSKVGDTSPKAYVNDVMVSMSMSQELKDEGNKLFCKRDLQGALMKYEKALKLLPTNHVGVSNLRSSMAACYMQMGLSEYPRAIHECDLALEVTPDYSIALLKRARCHKDLNRLDLALRDVSTVVKMEPNNVTALDLSEKVKNALEEKGLRVNDTIIELPPDYAEPPTSLPPQKVVKEKTQQKNTNKEKAPDNKIPKKQDGEKFEEKKADDSIVKKKTNKFKKKAKEKIDVRKAGIKEAVDEKCYGRGESEPKKTAKLIFGQDISSSCIEDWIIQFANLFKNHVGFESDRYLDFQDLGMKLYSEAMEETVTSEEAQDILDIAGDKFQEMTALALFNWGNVHMSRARKKVYFTEDYSKEHLCEQIKRSYEWAKKEYAKAGEKYEAAIKIKSDFYEAFLALGQQQFEQAKLSWYYALSSDVDLASWPSPEILQLYNNSEDNMEKGMLIWEEFEKNHLGKTSNSKDVRLHLQSMGLDGTFKTISSDDVAGQARNIRSQINLLWGTMLYERSIAEFKLKQPVWHESLESAVKKFEDVGASPTDIGVMLKNHCSNNTAVDGLGFKIDEIVQAWNEMYEAKRCQSGVPSFRLDPLFKRRVPKVYNAFELARVASFS